MARTWSEIFKIQAAIEALSGASAELGRISSIVDVDDDKTGKAIGAAMNANDEATRQLRELEAKLRVARENEDAMRKKALA